MHAHHDAAPVKRPLRTTTFMLAVAASVVGFALIGWRFWVGLGPATAMTDVQPWGIWKLFNVIALTSMASGGYAMALLVYVLNKGHYHSLVRHALLTSAVGYTAAIMALGIDVGSPWAFWKVFAWTWAWNADSVLLEVALCITAYIGVLWAEISPAFLETWAKERQGGLGKFARWALPRMDKILIWIIGLGILLPTMHQSSLGSLYLLAATKVHPYWQTPWLPLFFLLSCWIMGYAAVIITYIITSTRYRRATDNATLNRLGRAVSWIILAFLVARLADLIYRGQLPGLLTDDFYNWLLIAEFVLLGGAGIGLRRVKQNSLGPVYRLGLVIALGGVLYRGNVVWLGFRPLDGSFYFPSFIEMLIAGGFIMLQVAAYLFIVKRFAILDARSRPVRGEPVEQY